MIRRFDECIAEKANKMSLTELEHRVSQNYLQKKFWDELQIKFKSLTDNIDA